MGPQMLKTEHLLLCHRLAASQPGKHQVSGAPGHK